MEDSQNKRDSISLHTAENKTLCKTAVNT